MTFRRLSRWAGIAAALPVALIALFLLAAWLGSSIPRNAGWTQPDNGIRIMIETNGVHTGIIMPVISSEKDWRETFPSAGLPRTQDGWIPTHIAVGWGEKEVFLNTPTWRDLKAGTVLRILFQGGDGLLRVAHYVNPGASEYHREIYLRPDEYRQLVAQIDAALPPVADGQIRRSYESYEIGALHYDAKGRYTVANTCNQWVGDVLAKAGVKIGYWTPMSGGIMKWFPPPQN